MGVAAGIEQREQAVQNGAVGLEDLVEEDNLGLWQHSLDPPAVYTRAKRLDVHRTEDLVGFGEACEQVVEVLGLDHLGERAQQGALGRPGWAHHDQMLAGQRRDE